MTPLACFWDGDALGTRQATVSSCLRWWISLTSGDAGRHQYTPQDPEGMPPKAADDANRSSEEPIGLRPSIRSALARAALPGDPAGGNLQHAEEAIGAWTSTETYGKPSSRQPAAVFM